MERSLPCARQTRIRLWQLRLVVATSCRSIEGKERKIVHAPFRFARAIWFKLIVRRTRAGHETNEVEGKKKITRPRTFMQKRIFFANDRV